MSLDRYYGDDDCNGDPCTDEELLAWRKELKLYKTEQQNRDKEFLIAKLDWEFSWTRVRELLAAWEKENAEAVSREEELTQSFHEYLSFNLRLPKDDWKGYLLHLSVMVRDCGVCLCIIGSFLMIADLSVKFLEPYLAPFLPRHH